MKRKLLMSVLLLSGLVASADMYTYSIEGANLTTPELSSEPGAGKDWLVALVDNTGLELSSTTVAGNHSSLHVLIIGGWTTELLEEGTDVHYRVYNNTEAAGATYMIESPVYTLQDVDNPVPPGALDIDQGAGKAFDFTGATWVAVPEPATFGMMAVAGLGLFLARKKAHR